jgi:hypothetical protein
MLTRDAEHIKFRKPLDGKVKIGHSKEGKKCFPIMAKAHRLDAL